MANASLPQDDFGCSFTGRTESETKVAFEANSVCLCNILLTRLQDDFGRLSHLFTGHLNSNKKAVFLSPQFPANCDETPHIL